MGEIIIDIDCYIVEKKVQTFLGFIISEEKNKIKFATERYVLNKEKYYSLFRQTNVPIKEKDKLKILREYKDEFGIENYPQCFFESSYVENCKRNGYHYYDYYIYGLKRKKKKLNEFKKIDYEKKCTFFNEYDKLNSKELILLADDTYGKLINKQIEESSLLNEHIIEILKSTFNPNSITYDKFFNTINSVKNSIDTNTKVIIDKKYYNHNVSSNDFKNVYNKNEELLIQLKQLKCELIEIKEKRNNPDNVINEIKDLIEECKFYKK